MAPSRVPLTVEAGAYERPGRAAGPAPMELMLASLITCSGSTLDGVLAKMRLDVAGLNVVADGVRAERPPRVYTDIGLEFHVACEADRERLEHAIEVTERVCSASVMIGQVADLHTRLVQVRQVDPADTRELRKSVLRPHQSVDELAAEEHPSAVWFAAMADEVVGSVSISEEPPPGEQDGSSPVRLRSMATSEAMRGRGLGQVLLAAAVTRARKEGGDVLWCNARIAAVEFYRRAGFAETSEPFDVPDTGPHVQMSFRL